MQAITTIGLVLPSRYSRSAALMPAVRCPTTHQWLAARRQWELAKTSKAPQLGC